MFYKMRILILFIILPLLIHDLAAEDRGAKDIKHLAALINETRNFKKNDKVQKAARAKEKLSEILAGLKGEALVLGPDCPLIKSIVGWGHYAYAPKCAGIDRPGIGESIMAIEFSKSSRAILEKIDDLPQFTEFSVIFSVSDSTLTRDGDEAVLRGKITKIHKVMKPKPSTRSDVDATEAPDGNDSEIDPNEVLSKLKAGEKVEQNIVIKTIEKLLRER